MFNNQGWFLPLIIIIGGIIAQFAINKYQNGEFKKQIETLFKKTDNHSEDIVELQTQKNQYLTSDKADDVYLRRKEFEQFEKNMEKYIDKRFDTLEKGQFKMIEILENRKED